MSFKSTTSPDSLAPTSPFSNYSNLSTSSISNHSNNASPNFKSTTTTKERKSAIKHQTQLSTSSPAGIAVANKVTPERLAHLLSSTGPLAIRHITSNLAKQIQGFDKLSLSKQRRLIMSSLDQGFQEESTIFEKIGWGQWSAKKVDPENFIKERNSIRIHNAKVKDGETNNALRRESITKGKYEVDQHDNFLKKHNRPSTSSSATITSQTIAHDYAIESSDDEAIEEEDESQDHDASSVSDFYDGDGDDASNGVFKFDDEEQIPPLKLSSNSRLVSPPLNTATRSSRSSFSRGIQKPKFKSTRSNSQTPTSPELLYYQSIEKSNPSRRHSSIRSTLSANEQHDDSDTDEEDWQSIGAVKLRKSSLAPPEITIPNLPKNEQDAALALVNLRSL
ncbi:hypothetical protein BN7_6428 [Wickerhamomyces ciferrii]|uniref:Protein STB3 n=1 Tax=Wickerhamomyces ciferrii (strain ATCC 14091 / BCRC 22168 / CBS 111 / JCM 3599 / NBRC 0793 / NRRL Y-1031 F-60-10) TaxID=1206466 RepID=K0L092_WICCF|nr:uncharacterized protein BN7_6428 [Wickerhamomyces ciferrii]CCH46828.1 hypothetical protein BN7_6428 [Wickerhamomyces ciferrii]